MLRTGAYSSIMQPWWAPCGTIASNWVIMSRQWWLKRVVGANVVVMIATLIVVSAVLFAGLGFWVLREGLRDRSPRLRTMAWIVVVVCTAFLLGSLHRLALLVHRHGYMRDELGELLLADLLLTKSILSFTLAITGIVLIRRLVRDVRRLDRVVSVLTERTLLDVSVSELGLTPRELQVLEIIATGTLSDDEIARELYVSPSTAKTHVRNILRKAGVHSRRELVLFGLDRREM
jgi:DNA-binding CsgD family transcriptional regulator